MLQLEQRLRQRFPHWFRGRRAAIARPLLRGIARWSRLDAIDAFIKANRHVRGFDFVSAALQFLGADYAVDDAALARIPAHGRLLVIANHPSGALDALALLDAIGKVRRDVRIVANDMLSALDNLDGLLLPVRILGGRPAPDSLRAVDAALARGECVVVFPAGEVSRLGPRGIRDARYTELADTPADLHIEVQQVSHPSRVHLDIETDDLDAEVERLEKLGARRVAFVRRWWVMEAPTGQRFCVVRMKHPERGAVPNAWE